MNPLSRTILLVLSILLFLVAAFWAPIHSWDELKIDSLGLAAFAAAHLP